MTAIRTVCLLYLGAAGMADYRKKSIPLWLILAGMAAGIVCRIMSGSEMWPDVLYGLIPGSVMLLLYIATRGGIGCGDALSVLLIGISEGFWGCLMPTFFGLFLCGMAALAVIMTKRNRKHKLPFIPYLLMGYIVWLLYLNF